MSSCIFCGVSNPTEQIRFKDTFTAYQYVQAGDRACRRCATMLNDAKYRRNCWMLRGDEWTSIADPLSFLQNMPPPPFILYLTLQKRKHGWILAVQNPVYSKDKFILVVDEEKLLFERQRFTEYVAFSQNLLDRGVPKAVLLGGYPSASSIRRFGLSFMEASRLRSLQRDRLWNMVIKFGRKHDDGKETLRDGSRAITAKHRGPRGLETYWTEK